jgi:hypothetical protein
MNCNSSSFVAFVALGFLLNQSLWAQQSPAFPSNEFSLGVGYGSIQGLHSDNLPKAAALSLPNLQYMRRIHARWAVGLTLPGAIYKKNNLTRGWEGVVLTGKYFLNKGWFTTAGVGITLDAPAFWTVKNPSQATFYSGAPAALLAVGKTIYANPYVRVDLHYRFFYGQVNASPSLYAGISHQCILGFTLP